MTAISGIEIALWDLMGRALNTPIYNLFGGHFREQNPALRRLPRRRHARSADYAKRAKDVAASGSRRSSSISIPKIRLRSTSPTIRIRDGSGSSHSTAPLARRS